MKINGLDIEITTKCNLRCKYCYIGSKVHGVGGIMEDSIIDKCIELLKVYGGDSVKIRLYGGEPLLACDKIKQFIEKANAIGKNIRYTIMSNGTIANRGMREFLKSLPRNMLSIQRSIDGCREAQDITRPNSYDLYMKATDTYKDYRQNRRMTVVPETAKYLLKSLKDFEAHGFTGGISPIIDYGAEWDEKSTQEYLNSLWELADYFIEQYKKGKYIYIYYFARESAAQLSKTFTQFGCGAGKGLYAVSMDGDIYLCHRFTDTDKEGEFCFGTIDDALNKKEKGFGLRVLNRLDKVRRKEWNDECKSCKAKYGCYKGCIHSNNLTGNLDKPPALWCTVHKEVADIVSYMDMKLSGFDEEWWAHKNPRIEARKYLKNKEQNK